MILGWSINNLWLLGDQAIVYATALGNSCYKTMTERSKLKLGRFSTHYNETE